MHRSSEFQLADFTATPQPYRVTLHRSIDEVSSELWDPVVRGRSLFLQRRLLRCLEKETGEALQVRYAVITQNERPVGVASFQVTDFVGPSIEPLLDRSAGPMSLLARKLRLTRQELALRVMVCGNAFCAGEHGFAFVDGADPERAALGLVDAVAAAQRDEGGQEISAVLFKEFRPGSSALAAQLPDYAYTAFRAEPTLVLELDRRWVSFDDYLGSLRSKFRVKARRTFAKSAGLSVRELSSEDLVIHESRLSELYDAVLQRADYRLGRLPIPVLRHFRRELGDEFLLRGYFLGDRLVGFQSGFVTGDTLEAFLVGFDYRLNRRHAIYPRMLYDYLQLGLRRGVSRIHYGRTAGEIKSTLGAVPVELSCYIRHRQSTVNRLLPLLSRALRLPPVPVRRPFREEPELAPAPAI